MSATALAVQATAVAGGAALGALGRWSAGLWLNAAWPGFALGTLAVNLLGGLLAGVAMQVFTREPEAFWRLLLVTGFLGGFTTFSAFSAESLSLLQRGAWALAAWHTLAHVLGALACTAAGFMLARALLRG